MSSAELNKAAMVRCPFNDVVGENLYGVLKFTGGVAATETSHAQDVIPTYFYGQWVELTAIGGTVHYGFSVDPAAEVDRAVAATEAGVEAKVGGVIPDGETRHVWIPNLEKTQVLYFVRESSAVGTVVYFRLASG